VKCRGVNDLKVNLHNGFEEKKTTVSGSTINGLKAECKSIEDGGYQGHVFSNLTNCSIICLVVNLHQECKATISSVLDCFKSMKDQK
jgi:hypothetical protein